VSDFVHTILRDAFGLSDAEPTEDARTDLIVTQVARSRDDVDVDMRMQRVLCELGHVGLGAAGARLEGSRDPHHQWP